MADPPRVWHDGLRRELLAWERRADGWWAHLCHVAMRPRPLRMEDVFETVEDWQPAAAVQQIDGEDYSQVPRKLAAD
ncbi:hypothetical protein [Nonomuraea sp. bgisy101]|uniref:hypothetical protein n=1 Tax=Nonomuraea sp. bgisy101 TaxID=3413784 RepID=UPI003D7380EA